MAVSRDDGDNPRASSTALTAMTSECLASA